MARRIEIELTSARPDGSWTWRAAGAREPRGVLDGALLPGAAKAGDVLKAEAEFEIEGITIVSVVTPKESTRPEPQRIEIIGSGGPDTPGVTTQLVGRSDRRPGERRRDRETGAGDRRAAVMAPGPAGKALLPAATRLAPGRRRMGLLMPTARAGPAVPIGRPAPTDLSAPTRLIPPARPMVPAAPTGAIGPRLPVAPARGRPLAPVLAGAATKRRGAPATGPPGGHPSGPRRRHPRSAKPDGSARAAPTETR